MVVQHLQQRVCLARIYPSAYLLLAYPSESSLDHGLRSRFQTLEQDLKIVRVLCFTTRFLHVQRLQGKFSGERAQNYGGYTAPSDRKLIANDDRVGQQTI